MLTGTSWVKSSPVRAYRASGRMRKLISSEPLGPPLRPAPAPETVFVDEPDELPRLARLHHELGLAPEALDVILAMRQQLVRLQARLAHETARTRQLEDFVRGAGPLEDLG